MLPYCAGQVAASQYVAAAQAALDDVCNWLNEPTVKLPSGRGVSEKCAKRFDVGSTFPFRLESAMNLWDRRSATLTRMPSTSRESRVWGMLHSSDAKPISTRARNTTLAKRASSQCRFPM